MKNGRLHHESDRKEWRLNGLKHRLNAPAVIYNHTENEEYWFMGKRHRIDGPAVIKYRKEYTFNPTIIKKRNMRSPDDFSKGLTYEKVINEVEYWYNGRQYKKDDYDFLILFQKADKARRYI